MSSEKEVHLFDAPKYSADWTPEQIDNRYRPYFQHCPPDGTPTPEGTPTLQETPTAMGTPTSVTSVRIRGEATPIYLFLPEIAPELRRYNSDLKLIVLLRDPVERAISHYYMEKNRGYEKLPPWLALLSEPWRLRRCGNPRRHGSAWRRHAYRRRGLYSLQLSNLYRHIGPDRVLLVRTEDLGRRHDAVLGRVFDFLGVGACGGIEARTVFEGERGGRRHPVVSWLLRVSFAPEFIRMWRFKDPGARE